MNELFATPSEIAVIAFRTVVVYLFILIGFRLTGKREVGQLAPFDFALVLLIANAVQNAMVGQNTSLIAGLIAAGVILVLDLILHAAADRWESLRDFLDGEPTLLVDHGMILFENLRREGISDRELAVALRQNQLLSAEEALFVFLETNGQISVIPRRDGDGAGAPDLDGASKDPATRTKGSGSGFFRRRLRRPGRLSGGSG